MKIDFRRNPYTYPTEGPISKAACAIAGESENFPLFAPVFMAIGIGLYFSMPGEISLARAGTICALCLFAARVAKKDGAYGYLSTACACLAAGLFIAKAKTEILGTRILPSKIKGAFTTGRVIDVEPAGSDWRITIDNAIANGVETDLLRIRMPAKDKPPELGRGIEFKADILPPFAPTAIGSFDFGLYSYYKKYSGSGRLFDSYKYSSIQYDSRFIDKILFNFKIIKEKLNSAVFSTMSRDEAGVVISMMTGDIYAVSKRVAKNYRAAGISHIISISGFHMSLLAASVFFAVRTFLAFMPFIALRINTKKLAAACAFFATLFYLTLSGARIPAARAFIMTTLGLGAILFDRSVLSMRMVSASAAATLGIWPESLLNPGFWLSFAAVAVLVRLYDSRKNRDKRGGIAKAIKDNITASARIGLAITPFVIYGFNQAQIYAVAGNMIAVPIVSTVAMPAIFTAFIFAPFGIAKAPLWIAGKAIEIVNFAAAKIAAWPFANITLPSMPVSAIILFSIGLCFICLLKGKIRFVGYLLATTGMYIYITKPLPDVLADRFGTLFGYKCGSKLCLVNSSRYKPSRFLIADWMDRIGVEKFEIRSGKPFWPLTRIDRSVWTEGQGGEIYLRGGNAEIRTIKEWRGERPWSVYY